MEYLAVVPLDEQSNFSVRRAMPDEWFVEGWLSDVANSLKVATSTQPHT